MPATVNRKLNAVKRWLEWAGCHARVPKGIKEQRRRPRALERNEQNALLRAVERSGKPRDVVLIRIMLACGLRVSETVGLRVGDVELGERYGIITIRQGKGGKYREVPVPAETRRVLREYLIGKDGEDWLFPGKNGNHITSRAAQMIVSKYGYKARVKVHPHVLRHTCATNLLKTGVDTRVVAAILGHENINTTAIYAIPGVGDMGRALEGAEP